MRIKNLKLRGFIGIKEGLGLDEISIDLSNLSGLIALAGPNGKGKTTILDNLHPYRTLPSRNKSLQHHVYLRDSYRDFSFEFEGDEYRTLIKLDAESERTEGFIWKNEVSEVDGKVSNYDEYINKLFGSQSLFFNSVFCAQGSKKLADMKTADLKALFSEFLRLDTLIAYEKTAHQCAGILTQKNAKMENEIANLKSQVLCAEDLEESITNAKEKVKSDEEHLADLNIALAQAEAELNKLWQAASANDVQRQRLNDVIAQKEKVSAELKSEKEQFEMDLKAISKSIENADRDIKSSTDILNNADTILEAARKAATLERNIRTNSEHYEQMRSRSEQIHDGIRAKEKLLFSMQSNIQTLDADSGLAQLKHEIKTLQDKTKDLEKKDPDCESVTCSFIVGALEAQKRLPELQKRLSEQTEAIEKVRQDFSSTISDTKAKIASLESEHTESSKACEAFRQKTFADIAEHKKLSEIAKDKANIDVAKAKLEALQYRMGELLVEKERVAENFKNREDSKLSQINDLTHTVQSLRSNIDADIGQKVKNEEARIRQLKSDITTTSKAITELQGEISRLERTKEETLKKQQEIAEKEALRKTVLQELSEWQYLKAACSKDGLRALEIDSVAPMISGYANSLLATTFAPDYSLQFKTLDEETGREILDILVNRENGSVLLENLSGGEKVWCLKALRLAMTLVAKEKSGKRLETALSDEEDGALDGDNALNFISLYRAFADEGAFSSCLFISHKPECVAMADHVLMFGDEGVTLQ